MNRYPGCLRRSVSSSLDGVAAEQIVEGWATRGVHTESPSQNVWDSREDPSRRQEDGEIPHTDARYGCKNYITNPTHKRRRDEDKPPLLCAVSDERCDQRKQKGHKVWWCRESLCVNAAVAHVFEDGRKVDG